MKKQSEKDRALASKYLDYYRRAREDMERQGIFEKTERFDKYWQGNYVTKRSENHPASNTNIIHPMVEGQVAMLTEQNVSVSALPVSPSEVPFAKKAGSVLEFIKEQNKIHRVIERHERRREKYGTGIIRVIFDPDLLGGAGLPQIECADNSCVFIDPCITDPSKIQEAEFIIEAVVKSIYWAKETYGIDIASKIEENYFPYGEAENYDGNNAKYLHLLIWTREGGDLRLVEMSGDGTILSDSKENAKSFYAIGKYPYFLTPLYSKEGSVWGMGDVELLCDVQDLINDLDDQIRLNARLTANPQRLIETGSGIDLDSLTNEPGLNIPVNNINAVRDLQPCAIPDYIIERRNLALQYEAQKISRFSDQMMGSKQKGVDTATEALALQQNAHQGIAFKKLQLQETLSEVFSYCLALVREFWTDEVEIRIDSDSEEFIYFSAAELAAIKRLVPKDDGFIANGTKEAEFEIKVSVGAGLPANKAYQYTMILELTKGGILHPYETRKWLVENFGLPFEAVHPGQMMQGAVPKINKTAGKNPEVEGVSGGGQVMGGGRV